MRHTTLRYRDYSSHLVLLLKKYSCNTGFIRVFVLNSAQFSLENPSCQSFLNWFDAQRPAGPQPTGCSDRASSIRISLCIPWVFPHPRCGIWCPQWCHLFHQPSWTHWCHKPHGCPLTGHGPWRLSLAFLNQRFLVSDQGQ